MCVSLYIFKTSLLSFQIVTEKHTGTTSMMSIHDLLQTCSLSILYDKGKGVSAGSFQDVLSEPAPVIFIFSLFDNIRMP